MKRLESIGDKIIPIIFIGIIIVIWHFSVTLGYIEPYILPYPLDVISTLFEILPEIKEHLITTIQETLYGFAIAIALAIILAIAMDYVKIIKKAVYPVLVISQTIPVVVLAPLFAMWFGLYMMPKIIIVALICFFPILISLMEGLESVDTDLINLMKSMGASRFKIFTLIKFPASLVSFFAGLKVAATYCFMGAIIGEWMGGKMGLGLYMLRARKSFLIDKVFAVILIIVILSMAIFYSVSMIQYILMPWNRQKGENKNEKNNLSIDRINNSISSVSRMYEK